MTKQSSLAIDRGTLHLQVEIDLRGLVAGALFLAIFVAEVAIMRIPGPSYDAVSAGPFHNLNATTSQLPPSAGDDHEAPTCACRGG